MEGHLEWAHCQYISWLQPESQCLIQLQFQIHWLRHSPQTIKHPVYVYCGGEGTLSHRFLYYKLFIALTVMFPTLPFCSQPAKDTKHIQSSSLLRIRSVIQHARNFVKTTFGCNPPSVTSHGTYSAIHRSSELMLHRRRRHLRIP